MQRKFLFWNLNFLDHSFGEMDIVCEHCNALRWRAEKKTFCCQNGSGEEPENFQTGSGSRQNHRLRLQPRPRKIMRSTTFRMNFFRCEKFTSRKGHDIAKNQDLQLEPEPSQVRAQAQAPAPGEILRLQWLRLRLRFWLLSTGHIPSIYL